MLKRRYTFPIAVVAVAAVTAAVVVIVQSGRDGGKGKQEASCKEVPAPKPRTVKKRKAPTLKLNKGKTYVATVETSCGTFVIKLDTKEAPRTAASFVALARGGFYDGLGFHRISPGFVIQGGDPASDGTGGPGYKIREAPPRDAVYSEGVVAMAKGANEPAGTSGSQFFVVSGPDAGLPPDYALLGTVTKGMNVVRAIEGLNTSQDGPPSKPVVIEKVEINKSDSA